MESVIIFGTGGLFKSFYKYIYKVYDIKFLLDNDPSKHGLNIFGVTVIKPDRFISSGHERIIVASFYIDEIKSQLSELGVSAERIVNIADDSILLNMALSDIKININTIRVKREIEAITPCIKRDILFVVNSMVMGGSEVSLLNTLKKIDYTSNRVILIIINGGGGLTSRIPSEVVTIEIYKTPEECAIQQCLFRYVPSVVLSGIYIDRFFDIVISYTMGSSAKLACAISAHRKIAWIHSDLSASHPTRSSFLSIDDEANCYHKFTEIVLVSKAALNGFNQLFNHVNVNKRIIGNTFDVDEIMMKSVILSIDEHISFYKNNEGFKFIFVGRLSEEKGVIRLLNAFSDLLIINNNMQLIIIGHGSLFSTVKSIISDKNIDGNVLLAGECDNPYPYMRSADILILPSFYEGQPLVIGEAFILGLPIIATDSEACREMLRNGEFGLVVDNSESGILDGMHQAVSQENFISIYTQKSHLGLASLNTDIDDDIFGGI